MDSMKIYPGKKNGVEGWFVDWTENCKRTRKFFTAKSTAQTFASVTKQHLQDGTQVLFNLPEWERALIATAHNRAKAGGYTLIEACDALEKSRNLGTAITVRELYDRHVAAKRRLNLRPESLRQIEIVQKAFTDSFADRRASSLTAEEIGEWVDNPEWGPRRQYGVLGYLRSYYNFAVKAKLLADNTAKLVDDPIVEDKPTRILTVAQARGMMDLAQRRYPKLIPFLSVTMFAGLRTIEAIRLNWLDIEFERNLIRLSAGQTKTRVRRLVPLHDTAATWLTREPRRTGKVLKNFTALKRFRKEFGAYSRNVLRHSYISYELARSEDEAATAIRAGTSPEIIQKHYRELVTPQDAQEFWTILPQI